MSKPFSCAVCYDECRKRDVVCAKCFSILSQARKDALRNAPYSRDEKTRKLLNEMLLCEEVKLKTLIKERNSKPKKQEEVEAEVEAIYTVINPGKDNG